MENRVIIENIRPSPMNPSYSLKGVVSSNLEISCSIYTHGTDIVTGILEYGIPDEADLHYVPLISSGNDLFHASLPLERIGKVQFRVEAWVDQFANWIERIRSWRNAGEDVSADLPAGISIVEDTLNRTVEDDRKDLSTLFDLLRAKNIDRAIEFASGGMIRELMLKYQTRDHRVSSEWISVTVDPAYAEFASWYEMFPRSQGRDPRKSGTFKDCIARIPDIKRMGFDVIYLPPIHPIGITNRRGKNGSLKAGKNDPGSPWAIGNEEGGHYSIEKSLGTMLDFDNFLESCEKNGIKVALDLAYQCSPDHPYVKEHPEWFFHRPDGTIRYAENPPKKYYDIYPINFDCQNREALWEELRRIVVFWIGKGIRIFRVDNPHTKPFDFWNWLISSVKDMYPDVVFLSEAFTRPKVMYHLSMIGFSESYTYFTWRNYKSEIEEYFREIYSEEIRPFFRPMLFTNTPDILPFVLQKGGRPAFMIRAVLAATLSPLWGIYSGYELCENQAIEGKEEYLNSEKYEIRKRDWDAPGNIKPLITRLNSIRQLNRCLQERSGLVFVQAGNPNIIAYARISSDKSSMLLIIVNINPFETHEATVYVPLDLFGIPDGENYTVEDLLDGSRYTWHGSGNYVRLTPDTRPAHIFSIRGKIQYAA
jgi:starch synthase (maltosyl-transferring)